MQFVAIDATPQCEAGIARALKRQVEPIKPSANPKRATPRHSYSKVH